MSCRLPIICAENAGAEKLQNKSSTPIGLRRYPIEALWLAFAQKLAHAIMYKKRSAARQPTFVSV